MPSTTQPGASRLPTSTSSTEAITSSMIGPDFHQFIERLLSKHTRMAQICNRVDPNLVPIDLELPDALRSTINPSTHSLTDDDSTDSDDSHAK